MTDEELVQLLEAGGFTYTSHTFGGTWQKGTLFVNRLRGMPHLWSVNFFQSSTLNRSSNCGFYDTAEDVMSAVTAILLTEL